MTSIEIERLNDHQDWIYDSTIILTKPIVSGRNRLKKMRRQSVVKVIDEILRISEEDQEELLDVLSDLVINKELTEIEIIKLKEEIEDKMNQIKKIGAKFSNLTNYFNSLDEATKKDLIKLSIDKALVYFNGLKEAVIKSVWDKEASIQNTMILGKTIHTITEYLSKSSKKIKTKKVKEDYLEENLTVALILILKIEAYRRGKITIDELEQTLAGLPLEPNRKYVLPEEYKGVLEVLNA